MMLVTGIKAAVKYETYMTTAEYQTGTMSASAVLATTPTVSDIECAVQCTKDDRCLWWMVAGDVCTMYQERIDLLQLPNNPGQRVYTCMYRQAIHI